MFSGQVIDTIFKIVLTLALGGVLIALLPASPFDAMLESLEAVPYLGYLNWFLPIGKMVGALAAWGAAIGVYYGISWILRQLSIIGS